MAYKLWIDGQWVDSQGGGLMTIENPATGEKLAEVVDASPADVDRAVQAAQTAFYDGRWSKLTPGERSLALWKLADLIEARAAELARVESENTGKPYEFLSLGGDLPFAVDNLRFFAAAARDIHGFSAGEYAKGYTSLFRKEPVGVCAQITPWNYPLMMAVWKIGPALAAGCTVVLKPAPATPLTTLMLGELIAEAGIPPGVVNIVTGGNATGQALVEHPQVRMVSLTGSTATGKQVMRTAADTLKRVHLELGGQSAVYRLRGCGRRDRCCQGHICCHRQYRPRLYGSHPRLCAREQAGAGARGHCRSHAQSNGGIPFRGGSGDGAFGLSSPAGAGDGICGAGQSRGSQGADRRSDPFPACPGLLL